MRNVTLSEFVEAVEGLKDVEDAQLIPMILACRLTPMFVQHTGMDKLARNHADLIARLWIDKAKPEDAKRRERLQTIVEYFAQETRRKLMETEERFKGNPKG